MCGGWDALSDEVEDGCTGGVDGTDEAGTVVSATLLAGGACGFNPALGATDGTRTGAFIGGEGGTFWVRMNC